MAFGLWSVTYDPGSVVCCLVVLGLWSVVCGLVTCRPPLAGTSGGSGSAAACLVVRGRRRPPVPAPGTLTGGVTARRWLTPPPRRAVPSVMGRDDDGKTT